MVVAGLLAVFELGLRDGGAERDIPQRRRLRLVGLAALDVADERELRREERLVGDRAVRLRPVDREAQLTEEGFELLLVFGGQTLAQLDEVAARDRQLVGGFVLLLSPPSKGGVKSGSYGSDGSQRTP